MGLVEAWLGGYLLEVEWRGEARWVEPFGLADEIGKNTKKKKKTFK